MSFLAEICWHSVAPKGEFKSCFPLRRACSLRAVVQETVLSNFFPGAYYNYTVLSHYIVTQCCHTLSSLRGATLQITSEGSTLRPTAHRRAEVSTKWPHEPKHTLAKMNNDPKRCAYRFYNAPFMLRLVRRAVDNRSPEGLRGLGAFAPPVPSTT